ncbi:MAG: PAS domain-containing protein [Rhodospirillales bacterium]
MPARSAAAKPPVPLRGKSPIIDQTLAYWQRIRAGREMPARADLNPAEIPKLLPYVILMDVLREPLDFRYWLVGTEIDRICHRNYRGMKFSDLPDKKPPNPIWQHHREAVETRAPVRRELAYVGPDGDVRRIEHCLMPFSTDAKTVDQLLIAVEIERRF